MEDPEATREGAEAEQATEVLDVRAIRAGEPDEPESETDASGGEEAEPQDAAGADARRLVPRSRRMRVPAEILDASFSLSIRGYDRAQVDAYVERVERVVAALQRRRSPESAVKLALDRVGVQTAGVLQRAREASEEITATARADAEHLTRRAGVEAEETLERAVAEASALREQATRDAAEMVTSAAAEAEDRVHEAEQLVTTARTRAQEEIAALDRDVSRASKLQRQALSELRATASELEEFAAAVADRRRRGDGDSGSAPDTHSPDAAPDVAEGDGARARRITRRREAAGIVEWAASAGGH